MKDLIALAKSKPGQLNFASAGVGSGSHINAELLEFEAAIDIVHIPYKGAPEILNDLVAGRVNLYFSSPAAAIPFIRDGRMLALAVSTKERSPVLPHVPTAAEAGLPGFDFDQWFALLAPAKTPKLVINQLSKEVARVLEIEEIKSPGVPQGQEIMRIIRPTSATPSRLATILTILSMLSADIGFTE